MFRGSGLTICVGCGHAVPQAGCVCPLCGDVLIRTQTPIERDTLESELEQELMAA